MANPLSDPNDWVDQEVNTPPSQWDGVAYEWLGVFGAGQPEQFIDFIGDTGTVPDSFAVSVSTGTENFDIPHVLRVVWNMEEGETVETEALTPETTEEFTFTKPAGTLSGLFIQITSNGGEYPYAYSMDVAVTPIAQADPVADCEEYGRVTRAFVSGYQRDRIHYSRIVRGEKRCLVANFNGAIPAGRTIASAIWRCDQPFAVAMANGRIFENSRSSAVDITGQYGAGARIKCQVTLDNGEVYNQLFIVRVLNSPWFQGETAPSAGPYDLTVTA